MAFCGTDAELRLAEMFRQGDSEAMKSVYENYSGYLCAVCSRYVVQESDIHDILHDSFVKIFLNHGKFTWRGAGSLKAWMSKIVVNESLKFLRKRGKLDEVLREDSLTETDYEDENPEVEDIPQDVLERMIQSLPTGYRTVFNLFVFEGKSHKEIAKTLGIKENSSASQFFRAKNMLAAMIKDYKAKNDE